MLGSVHVDWARALQGLRVIPGEGSCQALLSPRTETKTHNFSRYCYSHKDNIYVYEVNILQAWTSHRILILHRHSGQYTAERAG